MARASRRKFYVDDRYLGTVPKDANHTTAGIRLTGPQAHLLLACRRLLGLGLSDLFAPDDVLRVVAEGLVTRVEGCSWDLALEASGWVASEILARSRRLPPLTPFCPLALDEAAKVANISRQSLAEAVAKGRLVPTVALPPRFAFTAAAILAWRDGE